MPPEALDNYEVITQSRDIWGCGVAMFYIAYKKHPFLENSKMKTNLNIYEGKFLIDSRIILGHDYKKTQIVRIQEPEDPFARWDSLIAACLKKDPAERVQNACILAEHKNIRNLICQLEAGILPLQLAVDESYEASLKLAIRRFKADKEINAIERRADFELQKIYQEDKNDLKLKGIGFYLGDDALISRVSFERQSELQKIVDAIEKGMKHFNLKVCRFSRTISLFFSFTGRKI